MVTTIIGSGDNPQLSLKDIWTLEEADRCADQLIVVIPKRVLRRFRERWTSLEIEARNRRDKRAWIKLARDLHIDISSVDEVHRGNPTRRQPVLPE